jgi:protein TonB
MKTAACFVAAVVAHALLLFGFRMEMPARPLEMSDEPAPVDVSLVEGAPEPPAAPPTVAPTPAEPASTPEPERPKPAPRRQEQKHPIPHSAPGTAASLAGSKDAAGHGAASGPVSSEARYLSNPRPDYPEEARQMRQQGVVLVNVEVDADGRAGEVSVSRSSGYPQLDEAAVRAVRRWRFEPARAGGLPVSSRVEVPVRFSLSE